MYYPYYDYYFDSYYNNDLTNVIVLVISSVLFFTTVLGIVQYVFFGLGLYNLGKNRGMKNTYLAFIPIANLYYLGRIADEIRLTMNKQQVHAKRLLIISIIEYVLVFLDTMIFSFCAIMGVMTKTFSIGLLALIFFLCFATLIFEIIKMVFQYLALYQIYKEYSPANATVFIVLSVIFPVIMPFLLFSVRNNKSGYQIWCEQQAAAQRFRENIDTGSGSL